MSSPPLVDQVEPQQESRSGLHHDQEKNGSVGEKVNDLDKSSDSDEDTISPDAQAGVQAIEAMTSVWSRRDLIIAYVLIWCIYFIDAMQQTTTGSLTPYVTSAFSAHSLTATTSIMSSLIGGIFQLALAKILDIWGRPQGFACMVFLLEVGLIMMAVCQNVQTYAAAQVFYWVGYNGMSFSLSLFIADTSALKNRAFAFAFVSSPYIATVWIGGPFAQAILEGPGFRWGFGIFVFLTLAVTVPLFILFAVNYRKAKKAGLLPVRNSGRTWIESLKYYAIEFDAIGVFLIASGLALFLLSFNLYSYQPTGWKSPTTLCLLVFGFVTIIGFGFYEKYVAPKTFIPYSLLLDRTVMGGCILAATLFVEFYIWDSFFYSFLLVVDNLTVTQATYVANIYSIGSCFFALLVGIYIRWSGHFKGLALYFGVPLTCLGVGLMVAFRQPNVNIGYIVMCQIFIAFSGGTLVICEQMAVMAATSHQYLAVVLAIESMFASVGGAIGSTLASAIWTGVFPKKLAQYLPAESLPDLDDIYESIVTQLSYDVGTPTRTAINRAYGDAQRDMIIAATAVLVLAFVGVLMWRDINVKNHKQVKGMVW